ncbi:hypothetical protein NSP_17350 [Nodularia spumigena CCY9414]|nr:hypothetical protein NSP_17350 [Nodularia spumigena CCY9414]
MQVKNGVRLKTRFAGYLIEGFVWEMGSEEICDSLLLTPMILRTLFNYTVD